MKHQQSFYEFDTASHSPDESANPEPPPQAPTTAKPTKFSFEEIAPLPDAHGFAGAFAGISEGTLLFAGGANFPDAPLWEGGKKVWTDSIFALASPDGEWEKIGTLPAPRGYGASITTPGGLLLIGGNNREGHLADCLLLHLENGLPRTTAYPPLPYALAEMSAVLLGRSVHITGGTHAPGATAAEELHLTLDLDDLENGWSCQVFPGPARVLATTAVVGNVLYLFSGASLSANAQQQPTRTYLKDAWRFDAENGWEKLPEMPHPTLAAPSPATVLDDGRILILGGDDGSLAGFTPASAHPGFPREVLCFHPASASFSALASIPEILPAAVTTPAVRWGRLTVIPSGEVRPATRTPRVICF